MGNRGGLADQASGFLGLPGRGGFFLLFYIFMSLSLPLPGYVLGMVLSYR